MLKCDRDERKHIVSVYIGLEKDYRLICCILNKKRKQKQKSLWKWKICVYFHKQQKKKKKVLHIILRILCVSRLNQSFNSHRRGRKCF